MRIYVTGSTGFIGKRVMNLLEKTNHHVEVLTDRLHEVDKYAPKLIKFNPDVVLHLAWEGIPDYGYEQSVKNLKYGLDLYDIIRNTDCKKVIVTGSLFEMDTILQSFGLFAEEIETELSYIGIAKKTLYKFGKKMFRDSIFIWARLFYVYGEGQREEALIPYMIKSSQQHKLVELKNPDDNLDYIHIDDVAQALYQLIEYGNKSKIYDIGSGQWIPLKEIRKQICNHYETAYPIDSCKYPFKLWNANIKDLQEDINWKPQITIEEGIKRMIKYYEK